MFTKSFEIKYICTFEITIAFGWRSAVDAERSCVGAGRRVTILASANDGVFQGEFRLRWGELLASAPVASAWSLFVEVHVLPFCLPPIHGWPSAAGLLPAHLNAAKAFQEKKN
ncbi:hypothetical protein K2X30_05605 [bacterium]|nr:hypothetical protein [bacterium]